MGVKFIKYDDRFSSQVFPDLVPQSYYNKYTSRSLFYTILRFTRIFKSDLYILTNDDRVVGCILIRRRVSFRLAGFRWFIYGVAVSQGQRGLGLGSQLIESCLSYCKAQKVNEIYLYVARDNSNALNLYTKHGFEVIASGNCLVEYVNRHKNEYLMRKVLGRLTTPAEK